MRPVLAVNTYRLLALCLLGIVGATDAWGHGRINTSISAEISEDKAVVTIKAALVDLMVIGGLDYETVARLSLEDRAGLLRPHLRTVSERFRLLDENDRTLIPGSVRFDIPNDPDSPPFPTGMDQQQMNVVMEYSLPSPPAWLMFWQSFGEGSTRDLYPKGHYHSRHDDRDFLHEETAAIPIYTALTIRQNGEMALLPTELGPGFPVRFPFSWDGDFTPLAHRASLQSATARWENRPANARLSVGEDNVTWKIYLTLEALAEGSADEFPARDLRDRLARHVAITIDGERRAPAAVEMTVHPMSAMALLHNRTLPPQTDRPGLAVLELSWDIAAPAREIEAAWAFYSDSMPRLYSEIQHAGEIAGFSILSGESPAARWTAGASRSCRR